ncbi:MAG TPA: AP2 domain-containing protein [Chloroflexi bacterium]|nr:AP2 domain-containing protein [Chloroflexota bacterium]
MSSIIRLDKPKNSKKGTHGWQVRVGPHKGYHSKLFSDNVYGSKGKALVAAEEYLDDYLKKNPEADKEQWPHGFHEGDLFASNTSGVTGVFRTHDYGRRDYKKETKQYYWGAFYSINRYGNTKTKNHRKFYVYQHGEEEARRLAIEFREMWEEAAKQGVEAVKRFFVEYDAGWLD